MSSPGQIVGGVIGGIVGAIAGGNVMLGASIGMAIGGAIDPPKGPNTVGPRLSDLSVQSSTFGVPLGHAYGTVPVLGNIFWLEGDKLKEVEAKKKSGGKGGASSTATTFTYFATFAIGLFVVRDPTQTIKLRKLWIGSNLVFDATATSAASAIASATEGVQFTFYDGSDPQSPNPRMQADKGTANVSGYPGLCYIVIEDLDLTKYSNSLEMAQVKAEVVVSGVNVPVITYLDTVQYPSPIPYGGARYVMPPSLFFAPTSIIHSAVADNNSDGHTACVVFGETTLAINQESLSVIAYDQPGSGFAQLAVSIIPAYSTDAAVQVMMLNLYGAFHPQQLAILDSAGQETLSNIDTYGVGYGVYCVVSAGDVYILGKEPSAVPIYYFSRGNFIVKGDSYSVCGAGVSENYLFLVENNIADTVATIYKLDRTTLALVETITGACEAVKPVIYVESDTRFWTASSQSSSSNLYLWENGVITRTFYDAMPAHLEKFEVYDPDELFAVSATFYGPTGTTEYYVTTLKVDEKSAKLRDIVTAECGFSGIDSSDIDLSTLTNSDVRGFRVSQGSARSALEQLQAIFPFDTTISGYKLKFVSRGGASVTTILESELGADPDHKPGNILLPIAREMDSQVPATVRVKHFDPDREYDIGEQFASRPGSASLGERTVETTVVLNTAEAAQAADVLNQKDWVERRDYGVFNLPPTRANLEPTDVITVQHRGTNHVLRLTHVEYLQDGRVSCSGRVTSPQSYTSTATGVAPLVLGEQSVPLRGATSAYLLDIPRIHSEQDAAGLSFGLLGMSSGWQGGTLFRTDDNGNTYKNIGANNINVEVYTAGAPLAGATGYSIDAVSILTVTPVTPGADLFSVTMDELFSESNLAAYGVDGRWEIVSFKNATDLTGSFSISGFLRGLYGTEWATGLHATGDLFIILDVNSVSFAAMQNNLFGIPLDYRPVTTGQSVDAVADVSFTYNAINLKPLAPVNLRGFRDLPSQDWVFEWDPRSRSAPNVFSGYSVPLSETPEQYVVKVLNGTTLVRTLPTVSTPSARYAAADQITDFGSKQDNIKFQVAKVSPICGNGYFAEKLQSHYLNTDDYFADVVLLLHFEGANNGTTFTDVKGHSFTPVVAVTKTDSPLVGGASGYFNGTNAYIQTPSTSDLNLGSDDFCIEITVNLPSVTAVQKLFGIWSDTSGGGFSYSFYSSLNGRIDFLWSTTGSNVFSVTTPNNVLTANTKQRIAIFRKLNVLYIAVEGVIVYSGAFTDTFYAVDSSRYFEVGRDGAGNAYYVNGLIDELRLTKNARYTGAYTPSDNQFPDG